jgi:hypothetical protein
VLVVSKHVNIPQYAIIPPSAVNNTNPLSVVARKHVPKRRLCRKGSMVKVGSNSLNDNARIIVSYSGEVTAYRLVAFFVLNELKIMFRVIHMVAA